ncbi:MAG TPA: hypothetical protein VLH18_08840, partial [Candidatus Limnocylindrales bacterium]|nr:hypothetical protein [Candidatus Limnocylindrales bacterium]
MKKKFIAFTKTRLVIGSLIMIFAIFQSPSFASSPVPQSGQAEASIKDETIFVNLGNDGGVEAINVINTFYRPAGEIRDYGDYVSIVNLTNAHEPAIEGNRITFKVDEEDGNINYQGELANRELPWLFEITYKLDGKKIDVQHLIGAAGHMQIILDVRQNTDALEYFRENYMLQINIPLEMDKASTVYAPGATMTVVGNTITLAFTLFPGESRMFVVEADVENFEMGGIEIAAIKAQMSLGQLEQD